MPIIKVKGRMTDAAALDGLSCAGLVVFEYVTATDQLHLYGEEPDPDLKTAALSGLTFPATPGQSFNFEWTGDDGVVSLWRGSVSPDGARAAGVVSLPTRASGDIDALTGLLPRSAFLSALASSIRRAQTDGMPMRLVVADLARMRRLNEALGLVRADRVLSAMGARLTHAYPAAALPARIGDNAFAVLVGTDDTDASEHLRSVLESPLTIDGINIHPVIAAAEGRALAQDAVSAEDLLRRAEMALGLIKDANRTRRAASAATEPAQAMNSDAESLAHLTLENDLRGAVSRGEIEPFFQPIVSLADQRIAGFEALVRWRHPRRGLMPPDDFLPLVNETGLISQISLFMARASVNQLEAWRITCPAAADLFVSVNLTTADLERDSLTAEMAEILSGASLRPGALKLEITESEVMRDPDRAAALLTELRAIGAELSLDDFGMGFSSLSWLARLPIQGLKIDRYFVRTMAANEGSAKIVRSIVNLARDFDLKVVAEGVESAAMANALREIGCQYGQGFGYAPPLSAEEALVFLLESEIDGVQFVRS